MLFSGSKTRQHFGFTLSRVYEVYHPLLFPDSQKLPCRLLKSCLVVLLLKNRVVAKKNEGIDQNYFTRSKRVRSLRFFFRVPCSSPYSVRLNERTLAPPQRTLVPPESLLLFPEETPSNIRKQKTAIFSLKKTPLNPQKEILLLGNVGLYFGRHGASYSFRWGSSVLKCGAKGWNSKRLE